MKGRPRKPLKLKLIEGNRGKRKLPETELKPVGKARCPRHLSKTAKAEWRRLAPKLEKLGLLTAIDGPALALYCQAYARWVEAEKHLENEDPVIESETGTAIYNPWWAVSNKAVQQMHKILGEFGMTPSTRSRVTIAEAPTESIGAILRREMKERETQPGPEGSEKDE
jgi:P27 family predicted phage terminase small subunit